MVKHTNGDEMHKHEKLAEMLLKMSTVCEPSDNNKVKEKSSTHDVIEHKFDHWTVIHNDLHCLEEVWIYMIKITKYICLVWNSDFTVDKMYEI